MQEYKIVACGLAEKIADKAAEWLADQGQSLSFLGALGEDGDVVSVTVAVDLQATALFESFVRGRYQSRLEGVKLYRLV